MEDDKGTGDDSSAAGSSKLAQASKQQLLALLKKQVSKSKVNETKVVEMKALCKKLMREKKELEAALDDKGSLQGQLNAEKEKYKFIEEELAQWKERVPDDYC